ncbi:MAG: hypothetical protein S0880_22730 [Actinomycetota bacterium]|nr:hypothetical protein [Actinomycetota bacterium]
MFFACWSVKGGSGASVVAAGLALSLARGSATGALLVDCDGDAPAVLGVAEPEGPGLAGWTAGAQGAAALSRLEQPAGSGLAVLPRGDGPLDASRADELLDALTGQPRPVVVDAGLLAANGDADHELARCLAAGATHSLLVTRPCYLALRRVAAAPIRPSGVVLVTEDGRSLRAADVEAVVEAPVVAEVPQDASIARAVDAGLLARRLPRSLERSLRSAA